MRSTAFLAILLCMASAPRLAVAQDSRGSIGPSKSQTTQPPIGREFNSAIETIATSTNRDAVNDADTALRNGGLPAINALVRHLEDRRQAPSNYLTRAVSGRVDMSDHCFWLSQDILESHKSKMHASYSPLDKQNLSKWLSDRDGKSLAELRREACIGSFAKIFAFGRDHPDFDIRPPVVSYAERLVELDRAVQDGE